MSVRLFSSSPFFQMSLGQRATRRKEESGENSATADQNLKTPDAECFLTSIYSTFLPCSLTLAPHPRWRLRCVV